MHKSIVFFRFMNILLNGLREYFVPMLTLYFEKNIELMTTMVELSGTTENKKRKRIEFNVEDDESGHSLHELILILV